MRLLLFLCFSPLAALPAIAQENSTNSVNAAAVNVSDLSSQITAISNTNAAMAAKLNSIINCQVSGGIYSPSAPTANATGCAQQGYNILGSGECMAPESGPTATGSNWVSRNLAGTATGCKTNGELRCSRGTPLQIAIYTDHLAHNEIGGFCNGDPAFRTDQCNVQNYWCIE